MEEGREGGFTGLFERSQTPTNDAYVSLVFRRGNLGWLDAPSVWVPRVCVRRQATGREHARPALCERASSMDLSQDAGRHTHICFRSCSSSDVMVVRMLYSSPGVGVGGGGWSDE